MIKLRTVGATEWAAIEVALDGVLHPVPNIVLPSHAVVAEDEGAVIGVAAVEVADAVGFLRLHFVRPAYRGQGLGTRIVRQAVQNGFERGLTSVFVFAATFETYYYRAGFGPDDFSFLPGCFWPRVASDRAHPPSVMSCRRGIGGRNSDGANSQGDLRVNPCFVPRRDGDFGP